MISETWMSTTLDAPGAKTAAIKHSSAVMLLIRDDRAHILE